MYTLGNHNQTKKKAIVLTDGSRPWPMVVVMMMMMSLSLIPMMSDYKCKSHISKQKRLNDGDD
ncbi:hypothetical protein BLOT_008520 [Blomia tropicalis]|nr:hypothetical protein BLOT_008520 [Blomia tropicalis]